MSEQNKATARAVFDVWNGGLLEELDPLVDENVIHHDPYDAHAARGLAGMKQTIAENRAAYPDLRIEVEDQVAEGDRVATRWRAAMTRDENRATLTGITIDRFERGKIVEAWRSMDMFGLLRQLGRLKT